MDQQLLSELNEVRGARKAAIVLKDIAAETSLLIREDGRYDELYRKWFGRLP